MNRCDVVVCRRIASNAQRSSGTSIEYLAEGKGASPDAGEMRHGTPGTCVDIKVDDVNVATLYLLRVV